MSKRRSKHWLPFLKTDLRRSRTRYCLIFLLFFLLVTASPCLFAQQTRFEVVKTEQSYLITLELRNIDTQELLTTLKNGHTAEVTFNIRIFKKTKGLFKLFGDRMVSEFHPVHTARWDIFNDHFTMTKHNGTSHTYESVESFLSAFLTLQNFTIADSYEPPRHYYAAGSVLLNTMKLVPPLTILAPFLSLRQKSAGWRRHELSEAAVTGGRG